MGEAAARFSFLLSIPIILAGGAKTKDLIEMHDDGMVRYFGGYGFVLPKRLSLAFIFFKFYKGLASCLFVYYRIVLGILFLFILWHSKYTFWRHEQESRAIGREWLSSILFLCEEKYLH